MSTPIQTPRRRLLATGFDPGALGQERIRPADTEAQREPGMLKGKKLIWVVVALAVAQQLWGDF